jgi:hypothetical protein
MDRLHFEISIVSATIRNEIDLAATRQKCRFIGDRAFETFVFGKDLR